MFQERAWNKLMEIARRQARVENERAVIKAMKNSKGQWVYVVQCPGTCPICN